MTTTRRRVNGGWPRALAAVAALALGASGCIDGERPQQPRDTTTADATDTSGAADGGLDISGGALAILAFSVDPAVITAGVDQAGAEVAGQATLRWETRGAGAVQLSTGGLAVALDDCVPAGDGSCAEGGELAVSPTESRTFSLRALPPGADCDARGGCPEADVTVEVRRPATVTLSAESTSVPAGDDVIVTYDVVDAESWMIGVALDGLAGDEPSVVPCAVAGAEGADEAPCVLPGVDGVADPAGAFTLAALDRGVTVVATATNGALDGLGDVALGDAVLDLAVPIDVRVFRATPARALPGTPIVLSWELRGAHAVTVAADPAGAATGLSTCVGLGSDGRGFCTVDLDPDLALGPVTFTLEATQLGGASLDANADVDVIAGPAVASFTATPDALVPGQTTTVAWTTFGSDTVALGAMPPGRVTGLSGCTAVGADGTGSCEVTIVAEAAPGAIVFSLEATHAAAGPGDTATLSLTVVEAPEVVAFDIADDTLTAGDPLELSWKVAHADFVTLSEPSGRIGQAALDACDGFDPDTGEGACVLTLPASLEPGALTFTLSATGPTGARSEVRERLVVVGEPPTAALSAAPSPLPEGGGVATLSWTASGADRVTIVDNAPVPTVAVDTDLGTICTGGAACEAEGDSVEVSVDRPTTWTLVATNDFGQAVASASVAIEGAPVVSSLTLDGQDVSGASVEVVTDAATLAWDTDNLDATDEVALDRAPLPGPGASCATVAEATWTAVAGFPRAGEASGQAELLGLAMPAACFRFAAVDLDATPPQRAVVIFKVRRAPEIENFALSDATVQRGDVVELGWETRFTYGVSVTAAPVGAVTAQDLSTCSAPGTSACAVTIQPGTPLGDVTFSLTARGEEAATAGPVDASLTVGIGATIGAFTASPASATEETSVTLSWTTSDGAALTIAGPDGEVFATSDGAVVASGAHTVSAVSATTTWTLRVDNAFGGAEARATTFVGASIDSLTANGGDALDGLEEVATGPVTIAWSTTSADGFHRLEVAPVPSGGCGDAAYEDVRFDDSPGAAASHDLGAITSNRCVRLTVGNTAEPPATSSATFLLREMPVVESLSTSPSTLGSNGGTVIIAMGLRGTTSLTLTAAYLNGNGASLGTRTVCNHNSLNGGTLSGGAGLDEVQCAHTVTPCNFLCLNNGMPGGTATVRYFLSARDVESDSVNVRSDEVGEDVAVD